MMAWADVWKDMDLASKANLARHCDLVLDQRLYYQLAKWDIDSHNFTRKGPFYSSNENSVVCETIVAILEEYFSEKGPGHLSWSGYLEWADWLDEPCWTVVDMQGGTMGDVWPESEGLKDGDTLVALVDVDNFIWFQTTIRQGEAGEWYLEGTHYKGDLQGIPVRQDTTIMFEEFRNKVEAGNEV